MRPRFFTASSRVLTISLAILSVSIPAAFAAQTHAPSDIALARDINIFAGDLPTGTAWTSAVQTANTPAQTKDADTAVTCMQRNGFAARKISRDPFGTVGKAGGSITTDIESLLFTKANSTGLPTVSSDVAITKTAAQASTDLAAFATKTDLGCITTLLGTVTAAAVGHQIGLTDSFIHIPRYGSGSGGVGVRFVITNAGLIGALYEDAFFYAQGRAEVSFSFVSVGSHLSSAWEDSITAKVMARAKHLLG